MRSIRALYRSDASYALDRDGARALRSLLGVKSPSGARGIHGNGVIAPLRPAPAPPTLAPRNPLARSPGL
ncbi:hypothetical protein EVAR_62571_1 [Eumeta japonica]|uniref:Uncharacterized protein n=1 Tax=Eumeta variegata TaxID=151549 RepID=A0A4C1YT47_EUMVA|nr:hypothetical protein EVAR_62571_1 [Eumeta japonica]